MPFRHALNVVGDRRGDAAESQLPFGSVPFRHAGVCSPGSIVEFESQLPFGSVPFRHRHPPSIRRHSASSVSITFRLSALSALPIYVKKADRKVASQLPFGSVPFRHTRTDGRVRMIGVRVSITFRLSALSAHKDLPIYVKKADRVSITFRLSALSARGVSILVRDRPDPSLNYLSAQCPFGTRRPWCPSSTVVRSSQLPFGSVPFRHEIMPTAFSDNTREGLNYLSAQCPFGTLILK